MGRSCKSLIGAGPLLLSIGLKFESDPVLLIGNNQAV
jgi:hypothetical protein